MAAKSPSLTVSDWARTIDGNRTLSAKANHQPNLPAIFLFAIICSLEIDVDLRFDLHFTAHGTCPFSKFQCAALTDRSRFPIQSSWSSDRHQKSENFSVSPPGAKRALRPLKNPVAENTQNAKGDRAAENLLDQKQLVRFPEQKS